ncbi:hypothetical protein [Mameliella sediminis]|uniref:hypothetical protein n=1 Tax=Mameliella sediminis TaxID=2836866 RepID=UPI001C46B6AB|nr:hypothetical protein [Mameliella sediminis]MBV7394840.1 hypothetical protein [Mameliella sediminis]
MSGTEESLMRRMWRDAPWLTAGLGLSLLIVLVFAVRMAMGMIFWADPRHQDMPIEAWMTPRFVGMSWHLPPEVVREALELTRDGKGPEPLWKIAQTRGVPVEDLIDDLEQAIAAHRGARHE